MTNDNLLKHAGEKRYNLSLHYFDEADGISREERERLLKEADDEIDKIKEESITEIYLPKNASQEYIDTLLKKYKLAKIVYTD